MTPNQLKQSQGAVDLLRWKLAWAVGFRSMLWLAGCWCLAWGTVVLAARYLWLEQSGRLLWGVIGVGIAGVVAAVWAWKKLPGRQALVAILDRHNQMGGLLMAEEDAELGKWALTMPRIEVPDVSGRAGQSLGLALLGAAFVVTALVLPDRIIRLDAPKPMDVSKPSAKLERQIETLKDHKIIDPTVAQTYQQQLEQIREEANGNDPAKTWEALDHLQNQMEQQAAQSAEKSIEQRRVTAQAQTIDQAILDAGNKIDPSKLSEALKELGDLTAKADEDNGQVMKIPEDLLKALEKAEPLTPEQLKKLADALKNGNTQIKEALKDLANAKLIDMSQVALDANPVDPGDVEALKDFLQQADPDATTGPGKSGEGNLMTMLQMRRRGGGGRGGGPADMTTQETSEEGAKFKEVTLPPKDLHSFKDSRLAGLSAASPKVDRAAEGSSHDALVSAEASGGEAHAQTLLPHHQASVKRFFERTHARNTGEGSGPNSGAAPTPSLGNGSGNGASPAAGGTGNS